MDHEMIMENGGYDVNTNWTRYARNHPLHTHTKFMRFRWAGYVPKNHARDKSFRESVFETPTSGPRGFREEEDARLVGQEPRGETI